MTTPPTPNEGGAFRPHAVAKAAGWLAVAQALSLCLKLALVPVLTRLLTPAEFGVVAASMALVLFLTMVGGRGGWSAALVVLGGGNRKLWSSAFTATLALSTIFGCALWVGATQVSRWMGIADAAEILRALAVLTPVIVGTEFLSTYLVSNNRYRADAQVGLFAEILAAIAGIVCALMGLGAWALVAQQFVAQGTRLIFLTLLSGLLPSWRPHWHAIAPLTPYASKAVVAEFVNFIGVQGPTILVAKSLGAVGAGLYGMSNRVTSLPGDIVMQSLSRILVPAFVAIDHAGERSKAVIWAGMANSILIMPILFGIAAIADPFCRFAFGPAFADSSGVIAGLAVGKAITAPCAGHYSYLKAVDRMGLLSLLMSARSILIVVGTMVGAFAGGVNGAAWGFAVAAIPTLALYSVAVFRVAHISWSAGFGSILFVVGSASIMAVCVRSFVEYGARHDFSDLYSILIGIMLGGAIYSGLMAFLFRQKIVAFLSKRRVFRSVV